MRTHRSKSGSLHFEDCLALTHDGVCQCAAEERWRSVVTLVAKVIYRDFEECSQEFVERVWSLDVPEFRETVRDFEATAVKVLDVLGGWPRFAEPGRAVSGDLVARLKAWYG